MKIPIKKKTDVLILGGGISGLALAGGLKGDWLLAERESELGGLCRSVKNGKFIFDYSGHLLHFRRPEIKRWIRNLYRGELLAHRRQAVIRWRRRQVPYPFQAHLGALSPKAAAACWRDYQRAPGLKYGPAIDFRSFIKGNFGEAMGREFFYPYNKKLLRTELGRLASDWVGPFLPRPSEQQVRRGMQGEAVEGLGYNPNFYYPSKGGIGSLPRLLAKRLPASRLLRNWDIAEIFPEEKRALTVDGREISYQRLVSTLPLKELAERCSPLPQAVRRAAGRLRYVGVQCANLGLQGKRSEGRHWIYLPGGKSPYYRLGFQSAFSPGLAPAGGSSIYLERSYLPGRRPEAGAAKRQAADFLCRAGYLEGKREIIELGLVDIPCAYVVYDLARQKAVNTLRRFLGEREIHLLGRYGAWEYSAMEDALCAGKRLAEVLSKRSGQ
jgi:protoporphyrinogen oxidase